MPNQANNDSALESLLQCMQHWSENQTNPVLDLLQGNDLIQNQKYPDPALACQDGLLQVFYHYHQKPFQFSDEHGHFHFFVHSPAIHERDAEWSHVAGLCINSQGQAIRWFTVNHWVTAGHWLCSTDLIHKIDQLEPPFNKQSVLQQWLVTMLVLFRPTIDGLLVERDQKLGELCSTHNMSPHEVMQNHEFYIMSEHIFDLHQFLSETFSDKIG